MEQFMLSFVNVSGNGGGVFFILMIELLVLLLPLLSGMFTNVPWIDRWYTHGLNHNLNTSMLNM